MKDKPVSHKEENTFKFESFNQRLSKINVSSLHHRDTYLIDDEHVTNFAQTLVKWGELNGTIHFDELRHAFGQEASIQTLTQIVHRKHDIIQVLLKQLEIKDNQALDAVLELIIALARDLQSEFYPYFARVFESLVLHLQTTNTETIENLFVCVTYLLKLLWRHMIKDLHSIFSLFSSRLLTSNQKSYIRIFASECFSFLIRKSQDKHQVIRLCFESVTNNEDLIEGIGQLLFETLKGVKNELHSIAHSFLPLIITQYLEYPAILPDNIQRTIHYLIHQLANHVDKNNSHILWDSIMLESNPSNNVSQHTKIINLMHFLINYKSCKLVVNSARVVDYLASLLQFELVPQDASLILSSLALLFHNCYQRISSQEFSIAVNKIYSAQKLSHDLVYEFSRNVFASAMFECHILTPLFQYCVSHLQSNKEHDKVFKKSLKVLAQLIQFKRSRPLFGEELNTFSRYEVKSMSGNKISQDDVEYIGGFLLSKMLSSSDLKIIKYCVVCLPNMCSSQVDGKLNDSFVTLMKRLRAQKIQDLVNNDLLVEFILSLILINSSSSLKTVLHEDFLIDLLRSYPSNVSVLRSLDFHLTHSKSNPHQVLQLKHLEDIYNFSLQHNLSSHSRINRLLSLHIMSLFEVTLPELIEEINIERKSVFEICLNAEKIVASVNNYRDKVRYLQKLEFPHVVNYIPLANPESEVDYEMMPIRYLFGSLYENFALLWPTIQKLISSFLTMHSNSRKMINFLFSFLEENISLSSSNETTTVAGIHQVSNNRADHANHRLLLLQIINSCVEVIEPRNHELVNLFLLFIKNEMNKFDIDDNSFEDICDSKEEEEDCEGEDETVLKDEQTHKNRISSSILWKTLFSFLEIFSKLKNPRAVYREAEMRQLYLNLLKFRDTKVQKAALKCILAYNHSYLTPYKDNLTNMIEDKSFKSEIFSFNSEDSEVSTLKEEHRAEIMPVLLRIMFGKMLSSSGIKTKGKQYADVRRGIVLRTLAGYQDTELAMFLDLMFAPILNFMQQDYAHLDDYVKHNLNMHKFLRLTQVNALLNNINHMIHCTGKTSQSSSGYILKASIVISYLISHLLSSTNRQQLKLSVVNKLKMLRKLCFKNTIEFFRLFDAYLFSDHEFNSLFESLVFPILPSLETECVSSPTPLLTLFSCWSQNPAFFHLLDKNHSLETHLSPIKVIIKIYENKKTNSKVRSLITNMFENLLTLEKEIENEDESEEKEMEQVSEVGRDLLRPHVSSILKRFSDKYDLAKKKKRTLFSRQELSVLSKISEFVSDNNECILLIKLLIASIEKPRNHSEEMIVQTLETISALAKHASPSHEQSQQLLRILAPMFGKIKDQHSRNELCFILSRISNKDYYAYITQLNSFNPRNPEEPDYNTRLEAFKMIKQMHLSDDEIDFNFELILLYNCTHFIKCCEDLALREISSHTIQNLVLKLMKQKDETIFNELAIKVLLYSQLKLGLTHKSETVRHEFIEILVTMIRNCHDKYPVLDQLFQLTNDIETDLDFWINIRHIQLHRRARALLKLAKDHEYLSSLSPQTILSFLLPFISNFFSDKRYEKNTSLIDASVEMIGSFCKHLPWNFYHNLLKKNLKKLTKSTEDQKVTIKVISAMLNNFSFDLSGLNGKQSLNNQKNKLKGKKNNSVEETKTEEDSKTLNDSNQILEKKQVSHELGSKIYKELSLSLLPQLHRCLHYKSTIDYASDSKMKNEYPEDEEIQRIPIALAMVKLLKSLSPEMLKTNLPSIILRICTFLQSRLERIRQTARTTLVRIMHTLGPQFFPYVLKELRETLRKGYQLHVLTYTIHNLLTSLTSDLKVGDLDPCVESLGQVFTMELFSGLSEEKEVSKIATKYKEAKKCKSYESYQILANFVSENNILKLLQPLKCTLMEAYSQKVIKKVSLCLQKISLGFISNRGLSEKTLLVFVHGMMSNVIEEMKMNRKSVTKKEKNKSLMESSSLLLPEKNKKIRIGSSTNEHILSEFALKLLHHLLKGSRLSSDNSEHIALLDPFVSILDGFLDSKSPKLTSLSLQCLLLLLKFGSLQSFQTHSSNISKKIFLIIKTFSGANNEQDENALLVAMAFRAVNLILYNMEHFNLEDDQLKVLILYVDQNISQDTRQVTAFSLLKSILSRKLKTPELGQIMSKVSDLCIQSNLDNIRDKCKELWLKYLREYVHKNKFRKNILSMMRNLEYEHESGRQSALDIMDTIVCTFPQKMIMFNAGLILVPLASRLVNEDAAKLRNNAAKTIEKLIKRLKDIDRNQIFTNFIMPWLQDSDINQRLLAAQLISIYIDVEKENFSSRLPICFPLITQQLDPDRYLTQTSINGNGSGSGNGNGNDNGNGIDSENDSTSKSSDNLVYNILNVFLKLIKACPDINDKPKMRENVNLILSHVEHHYLLHSHTWVRLISVQMFGQLFSSYSPEMISNSVISPQAEAKEYLLVNTKKKLLNLCNKFGLLFRDIYNDPLLSDQIVKNLIYIARVLMLLPKEEAIDEKIDKMNRLSLEWLVKLLLREVRYEITNNPTQDAKRKGVFKWIAAISLELEKERLEDYLSLMLLPLVRESLDNTIHTDVCLNEEEPEQDQLSSLSKQVLDIIKNIMGSDKFVSYYNQARESLTLKRLERKKRRAIEIVSNPVKSARRKIKKHLIDQTSKKRKKNFQQSKSSSKRVRGK